MTEEVRRFLAEQIGDISARLRAVVDIMRNEPGVSMADEPFPSLMPPLDRDLCEVLKKCLATNGPLTARELSAITGRSNHAVRNIVYSNPAFVRIPRDGPGTRVRWKLLTLPADERKGDGQK